MTDQIVKIVYVLQKTSEASKRASKKYFEANKDKIYQRRKEWRLNNEEYRIRSSQNKMKSRLVQREVNGLMSISPEIFL